MSATTEVTVWCDGPYREQQQYASITVPPPPPGTPCGNWYTGGAPASNVRNEARSLGWTTRRHPEGGRLRDYCPTHRNLGSVG